MVRTYTFNPSTQSSADSNLPCGKKSTIIQDKNFFLLTCNNNDKQQHFQQYNKENSVKNCNIDCKFAKSMINLPNLTDITLNSYNDKNISIIDSLQPTSQFNNNDAIKKLQTSLNNSKNNLTQNESLLNIKPSITVNNLNFSHDLQNSPTIFDETTEFFGIRSVLINDQRFYQPIKFYLNSINNKKNNVKNCTNSLTNYQDNNFLNEDAKLNAFSAAILLNQEYKIYNF